MAGQGICQFFIDSDQLRLCFHSKHNVNAVVNAPPVQDSFLERWIQKVQGRNRRNLVFKQCGQRSNSGLLGAAAAADGLPENIRQFDPEEIGNNQVDFAEDAKPGREMAPQTQAVPTWRRHWHPPQIHSPFAIHTDHFLS